MNYILRVLVAVDQLVNVVICNGEPDETLSSAAYRMERDGYFWGFMRPVIDMMFYVFESDHCRKAFESERSRRHAPQEFRGS